MSLAYEPEITRMIAEREPEIYINWINLPPKEARNGVADKITAALFAAGYKPDPSVVAEPYRQLYVSDTTDYMGRYMRVPQETWTLEG